MHRLALFALLVVTVLVATDAQPKQAAAASQIFIVNTDSGGYDGVCDANCTLRDAVFQSNSTGERDTINFAILPATGVKTIVLDEPIVITNSVTIDGTTQGGSDCSPRDLRIEIDGSSAGAADGITINHIGQGTLINGVAVRDWNGHGIVIAGGALHSVRCSNIGTNAAGTAAASNSGDGVRILAATTGAGGILIGANRLAAPPDDEERNIISGNGGAGVNSAFGGGGSGAGGGRLRVSGNYIGTNAAGTAAIPNGNSGVIITSGPTSVGRDPAGGSGGVSAGNLISGNTGAGNAGVEILATADNPQVHGNTIGLNAAGTAAIPNQNGIIVAADLTFIGTDDPTWGNVISGNTEDGVRVLEGGDASLRHNRIGTNVAGTAAVPNGRGIWSEGRVSVGAAGHGNTISGNTGDGVTVIASPALIVANYIGYAQDGVTPLPNGGDGIGIYSHPTRAEEQGSSIGSTGLSDQNRIYARRPNGSLPLRHGVRIEQTDGHAALRTFYIEGSSINSDGHGIELRRPADLANSVTPDDPFDVDDGPNGFQNAPSVTGAFTSPSLTIQGTIHGEAGQFHTLHFYKSSTCDSATSRQGHAYLGTLLTFTDVVTGDVTWEASTLASFAPGDWITATARSWANDGTSEFSNCFQATGGATPLAQALSPSEKVANAFEFNLQVTGTNFGTDSKIYWDGQEISNTVFFANNDVRANIPANLIGPSKGTIQVFVRTNGNDSNSLPFTIHRSSSDINCSGAVDMNDALLLLKVLAGLATNNTACSSNANGDGGVTIADATWIRQEMAGLREGVQSATP